jgi:biopolymer transport protein ExbB/TolQ
MLNLNFKVMFDLFYMGGPLFMGILTLLLFFILGLSVFNLFLVLKKEYKELPAFKKKLKYIRNLGLLAIIIGFLGQMIGLFDAFNAIEAAGDISTSILAGGLKVSMVTPIWGTLIYLISYILWFILDLMASRKMDA